MGLMGSNESLPFDPAAEEGRSTEVDNILMGSKVLPMNKRGKRPGDEAYIKNNMRLNRLKGMQLDDACYCWENS